MGRLIRVIGFLAILLFFVVVVCGGFVYIATGGQVLDSVQTALIQLALYSRQDELNRPVGGDTTPVRFTVAMGDTPRLIGQKLVEASLISDAGLFVDYVRANDLDVELEAGTYFLNKAQTIPEIAVRLTDSSSSQFPFRILEGWRSEEVAAAIDDNPYFGFSGADFLAVVGPGAQVDPALAAQVGLPPGASLEGFLYPDSYQLPAEVTPTMLRDTLIETFLDRAGAQLALDAAAQDLTLYEVVTLASIVQREAVHQDEHALIASVYRNRLSLGIKLDADPTVQYAIGYRGERWWPFITGAEYTSVISDYNTYLNYGLPPGPIASPGLSAIRAAIYPAESSYLYFRADCSPDGYHSFATTYDEHLMNGC